MYFVSYKIQPWGKNYKKKYKEINKTVKTRNRLDCKQKCDTLIHWK